MKLGKYLLGVSGVKFLLSERFTQDPVKTFFSQQRQKGGEISLVPSRLCS